MAPELHEADENEVYLYDHSVKSDVWSLGVILYSLAYSKSPFAEESFEVRFCLNARVCFDNDATFD